MARDQHAGWTFAAAPRQEHTAAAVRRRSIPKARLPASCAHLVNRNLRVSHVRRPSADALRCPHSRSLPDSPTAVRLARELVGGLWRDWGFPPDDVVPRLVTSELVNNALRHAYPPRGLLVARHGTDQVL